MKIVDVGRQSTETLLAGPTDPDKHGMPARILNDATNSGDVQHGLFE